MYSNSSFCQYDLKGLYGRQWRATTVVGDSTTSSSEIEFHDLILVLIALFFFFSIKYTQVLKAIIIRMRILINCQKKIKI